MHGSMRQLLNDARVRNSHSARRRLTCLLRTQQHGFHQRDNAPLLLQQVAQEDADRALIRDGDGADRQLLLDALLDDAELDVPLLRARAMAACCAVS